MIFHMKRTTLIIDERQFAELKSLAAAERRTLSAVTRDLLRLGLAALHKRGRRRLPPLPTFNMGKFKVDVADRKALHRAMEGSPKARKQGRRKLPPLPTFNMGKPKVDLADRNALYAAMEGR